MTTTNPRAEAPVVERVAPEREINIVHERETAYDPATARALQWGPILAGLVVTLSAFLMLSLLVAGIGLAAVNPDGSPPTAVATIVTSIVALLSFFLGGLVASWSGRATNGARGALYGFLVFASWLIVVLLMSGMGLGSLFGEIGSVLGNVRAPDLSQEEILNAISTGALSAFLALALAGLAGALGGAVGANDRLYERR